METSKKTDRPFALLGFIVAAASGYWTLACILLAWGFINRWLQALVVGWVILLARRITDSGPTGTRPRFHVTGAVLSAAGLFFVVLGILQTGRVGWASS